MLRKLLLSSVTVGVIGATAASNGYHVQIYQDLVVEGKSIKAGDYTIEMQNNIAVIKQGKETIEVPAHMEAATNKFANTEMEYLGNKLQEIHVGGSRTKIVFGGDKATANGTK
jgi:hypothetical protein